MVEALEILLKFNSDATILPYGKEEEKCLKPITLQDPMKSFPDIWTMLCQHCHVVRLFNLQKAKKQGSNEEEEKVSTYSKGGGKKKKSYDVYGTLRIRSSHDLSHTIQHLLMDLQEIGIKLHYNWL